MEYPIMGIWIYLNGDNIEAKIEGNEGILEEAEGSVEEEEEGYKVYFERV